MKLNEVFRLAASSNASKENEIDELKQFSSIDVPREYIEIICEKTEMEICILEQKYIRIWGAKGCVEMNEAYFIQRYIPQSLAIGDDEDGNAILYAKGKDGFGIYTVAFNDIDIEEMIFISKSLKELLIYGKGVEKLLDL